MENDEDHDEREIIKFSFSNRYYLTGPVRFCAGLFMVWLPALRRYTLTDQRLRIEIGVLSKHEDEIELYRIKDVHYRASLFERMMGIGNIEITSTQVGGNYLYVKAIKNPRRVRELIRDTVQKSRRRHGTREFDNFSDN
ncbi:PH domain-containing protein [Komagataeibacter sp. FNDCR2]|uniref:PH domain-containing protein n=1 Tax=Komagataeibacter sp. FNDCR2 TaxID=2878682 RepID=UPI001E64FF82|nr:PH domain-containing protein [Komagataeibacter sp. FNDCR2]MCE2575274.1 PH domain-containing protein [Komagataeibacter sp. FNDCR2]